MNGPIFTLDELRRAGYVPAESDSEETSLVPPDER